MGILTGVRLFEHVALLYEGLDDLARSSEAFIKDGLSRDEPVMVLVPQDHLGAIRDHLGADAAQVTFGSMSEMGRNPSAIISHWLDFVASHPGRRVRGIGEPIWKGRSPEELVECHRHEALINLAFQEANASILCPYDMASLSPEVISESFRTHPVMIDDKGRRESDRVMGLTEIDKVASNGLSQPPREARAFTFGSDSFATIRSFVRDESLKFGLSPQKTEDLVLAVNEVVTNSIRHAKSSGELAAWTTENSLIVEIRDSGMIQNSLAGRARPDANAQGGYGLWLVNQLCDFVQIRSSEHGNAFRLHMSRK